MESVYEKNTRPETDENNTHWLTEDLVQALLNIPADGLFGVNMALLFSREQELCAYWWRERTGTHHATVVSPQAVKAALNAIPIDSGYLPSGTLRIGITPNGEPWMVVSLPPRSYHFTMERDDKSQHTIALGLPGAVMLGHADRFWIWAVKETQVSETTRLYHFPLPNIGPDGTMCYGENHPSKVAWPQILPAFYLFMESPFSDHWSAGKSAHHLGDIRTHLFQLAEHSPAVFPEEELLPLLYTRSPGMPVTLHALVQSIIEGR
jgi:Prokaryotic E2 family D